MRRPDCAAPRTLSLWLRPEVVPVTPELCLPRTVCFLSRHSVPHPARTAADLFLRAAPLQPRPDLALPGNPVRGALTTRSPAIGVYVSLQAFSWRANSPAALWLVKRLQE